MPQQTYPGHCSRGYLLNSHNPSIVNISSIAGIKGIGSSIAYAASKGALNTMTLSMARNLGPIRVNAVCPGFIEGDWLKNGMGMEVDFKARCLVGDGVAEIQMFEQV